MIRLALLGALLVAATARAALENSDCYACHGDKELVRTNANRQVQSLYVDAKAYDVSIHGKSLCTSCHADIKDVPHPDKLKPVSCAQCHGRKQETKTPGLQPPVVAFAYEHSVHGLARANGVTKAAACADCHGKHDIFRPTSSQSRLHWQQIPATCGRCHEKAYQDFGRSIHGKALAKGARDAPVCTDCHGEHTITAAKAETSRVSSGHIPETCGQCHGLERIATRYRLPSNVVQTYMQSFHGLALQMGGVAAANCASCHGFHDVLPSRDPSSSVNQANLPHTCGKCHPGIGTRLAKGDIKIHRPPGADKDKPWLVNFVTRFYIVLIVLTIGGMAAFNALDYLAKTRAHVCAARVAGGELRMSKGVRVQHLLMMALFIALVYTGFVHKFPDAFWSWPFRALQNGAHVRGMIHRIAGWAFTLLFAVHLMALFGTARGRGYVKELWPRFHDIKDGLRQLFHNLGLCKEPPPHRRFNYAEKAEYWALVWGSFVMIVTGAMLIFTETVLRMLPKVWLDVAQVIHYYEAVLATLAIVVWHFYWVIFDPKEYPMNPAWLIGNKAKGTP